MSSDPRGRIPRARRRALGLLLGALAVAACAEAPSTPGGSPPGPGTYRLVSLAGRALPTTAPCGVFQVVEGSLSLEPDGAAEHRLRYAELGTGREVTYSGTGRYREAADGVELELTGRWSNAPQSEPSVITLKAAEGGLTRPTGMECDAAEIELYRLPEP